MRRTAFLKKFRGLGGRIALLSASVAISLLVSEAVVRWTAPQQLTLLRPDVWTPDESLGWKRAPNLATRINTGERKVQLVTDENGWRVGANGPPGDAQRSVLALGDSFLEALQVEYEDSFAGLIELRLAEQLKTPVRVAATGVAGYDPNHYLLQTRMELARRSFDAVLVFLFLGNDIVYERRERIPPKTPKTIRKFRWPRALEARELIDSTLYPLNDFLERRSHLFVLLRSRLPFVKSRLVALRHAAKKQTSDPSAVFRDHVLNPQIANSPRWDLTAEICDEIRHLGQEQGVPTLIVLLPRSSWVDPEELLLEAAGLGIDPARMDIDQPFREMRRALTERGVPFVDTKPAFDAAWKRGEHRLFGRVDKHLAPAGHRLVAEIVLGPLLRSMESDPPPP